MSSILDVRNKLLCVLFMTKYKIYLLNAYTINKILKETKSTCVLLVTDNTTNHKYIAKILILANTHDKMEILNIDTEIQALKYFTHYLILPFFPKYISDYHSDKNNMVIMEYIPGKALIEYDNKKLSIRWWKSLIYQLILIIYVLEDNRILQNDCWDANIMIKSHSKKISVNYKNRLYEIPKCNFIVKIIDFQYTHQYTDNAYIYSPHVATKIKKYQLEKKRLGWSEKFHVGGDLNQILGLLSNYRNIPAKLKQYIHKNVIKNEKSDFPFAIQSNNKKTSGKYLLKHFGELF